MPVRKKRTCSVSVTLSSRNGIVLLRDKNELWATPITFAKFVHRCPNSASLPFPLDFLLFANAIFVIFINECFGRCRIIPLLLLLYLPKLPCDVLWALFSFLISYSCFICDCCYQVFMKLQINLLLPYTNVLNLWRSEGSLSLCHIAFLTLLFLLLLRLLLTWFIEVAD